MEEARLVEWTAARSSLFANVHAHPDSHDELHDPDGQMRFAWQTVFGRIDAMGPDRLERGWQLAKRLMRDNGITYQRIGAIEDESQRPWKLDALPWLLDESSWTELSRGLRQRAVLLNKILADLYGPQSIIQQGLVPSELIFSHPGYQRSFVHLHVPNQLFLHCYTADLARGPDGQWSVMADRTDAPLGVGYALENRLVLSRTYPSIFRDSNVERLAPFFIQLRSLLQQHAPQNNNNPHVVLLSEGPNTAGYFEDVYLARYLGYTLAESGDLTIRNDQVLLKTLGALVPVDVIFRRFSDQYCDPLELQSDPSLGVAGLVRAVRAGRVLVINALGSSILESAAFMPYLSRLCEYFLGESLLIPSIPTWWCGRKSDLEHVHSNHPPLLLANAFRVGRKKVGIYPWNSDANDAKRLKELSYRPEMYVGQSRIERSSVPVWNGTGVESMRAALRVYLVAAGNDYMVLPGGLARTAPTNEKLESDVLAGNNSKDVWVLSSGPVAPVSLLKPNTQPTPLKRGGAELPSRVADNLLWLGRYVERVESSARLLRTSLSRLNREVNISLLPEWPGLVRQLASRGLIEPGYAVPVLQDQLPSLPDRLPAIVFDDNHPENLRDGLKQIVRIASILRDRLSPDSWRVLSHLDSRISTVQSTISREPTDAIGLLGDLITDLSAFLGMIAESMTRTLGWRFLDLGRRLERAMGSTNIVRQLTDGETCEPAEWEALLEASDSLMTYRFRYLANWSLDAVVDLLFNDDTNPRSTHYQLLAIHEHIQKIVATSNNSPSSSEKMLTSRMLAQIKRVTPDDLFQAAEKKQESLVYQVADGLFQDLHRLTELINARYVMHANPVRNRGK